MSRIEWVIENIIIINNNETLKNPAIFIIPKKSIVFRSIGVMQRFHKVCIRFLGGPDFSSAWSFVKVFSKS